MSKLSSEEKEVLDLLRGSGFSLSSGVSGMENELRSLSLASSWGVEGDRFSILWSVQLQLSMAAERLFWIYHQIRATRQDKRANEVFLARLPGLHSLFHHCFKSTTTSMTNTIAFLIFYISTSKHKNSIPFGSFGKMDRAIATIITKK